MAAEIEWTAIELQIENLIPGILLAAEISAFTPKTTNAIAIYSIIYPFAAGALFVAISYTIGLVSSHISRFILDSLSERKVRAWVFEKQVHGSRKSLVEHFEKIDSRFKDDFKYEKEQRKRKEKIAEWNAIYRSAIRKSTDDNEVKRRRSQGRLTRNLFFPIILVVILLLRGIFKASCLSVLVVTLGAFLAACVGLFLYSYAEYIVMTEAYDISLKKQSSSPGAPSSCC